ncbi:protein SYS1 homolog [Actinia tenebrosa]|uniref:Protein SYS1 homolog n=1 Tax=Actinia tenebrosa TaxID=6105 RepID=A0A6P8HLF2_ACTTE|nr:protein SYS1 homolog [Actinia tenebrosa]
MATTQFRTYVWDPVLIISQIIALQCTYYLSLGFLVYLVDYWSSSMRSLDQFFNYKEITTSTLKGKLLITSFCLNSLAGAMALWFIVKRGKQCLDFTTTIFVIHLLLCCVYYGFPLSWTWWIVNIVWVALMAIIGEFVCMRTELRAIMVSVGSARNSV